MKYGFVYIWRDKKHKRFYIGSHWGTIGDGYVCSSSWMKQAYKRRPGDFKRKILKTNIDRASLIVEEQKWLSLIKDNEIGSKYYNLNKNAIKHWHVNPTSRLTVGQKISASPNRAANISRAMKGRRPHDVTIQKAREANIGRIQTQQEKDKRAASHLGSKHNWLNTDTSKMGQHIVGTKRSETTKIKTRQTVLMNPYTHDAIAKQKISRAMKGKYAGTVAVTTKDGINKRIEKTLFDKQKSGEMSNWDYVSVTSKESKRRRGLI